MNYLRQLCPTAILILAFALSTYAGDMQFPVTTSPEPTPSAAGIIQFPIIASSDPVMQIALTLVQSALSLF